MCGILGQLNSSQPIGRERFERMLDTLAFRGPDGRGTAYFDDDRVALGHRRLAIIDLSDDAAQPMANESGDVWLVFNGEIYNFRELRKDLETRGHRFRSHSDSEVILHGYEEWGDDCVCRLRGIFAFGIWDGRRRRLLLARDHLGVKPLYYWSDAGRIVFASQPRAILQAEGFRKSLDPVSLSRYFAYGYVGGDRSIFDGISKLRPAHRLTWEAGRLAIDRYWQARYAPQVRTVDDAVAMAQEKIEEAVRLQMVADVPVGLFLSGGVDSSSVAAIACRAAGGPLDSFTIGFDDPEWDERSYAREAARQIPTRYHEKVLTRSEAVERIAAFAEIYDEPFFDHSGLPTYFISEMVRDHRYKVILSGDGGDEIFAGYEWYDRYSEYERSIASLTGRARLRRLLGTLARALTGRRRHAADPFFYFAGIMDARQQRRLLPRRAAPSADDHLTLFRDASRQDCPAVTRAQLIDLETYLVDDILTKVDRASMACGVEVRVPLLDHRLVEAAFSIDHEVIFAGGERKWLMKRAMSRWLPPSVLTPRKQGFTCPVAAWFTEDFRDAAARLVLDGSLVSRGAISARGASDLLDTRSPNRIWLLLAAELWARRWLEEEAPDSWKLTERLNTKLRCS